MKYKRTNINSFITHFFNFKVFRNKFYYRSISISNFITYFLNFVAIGGKTKMHLNNYQQLDYAFLYFCSWQEKTLMFYHFLQRLYYTFLESYINQDLSYYEWQHFICMFEHSFSFKGIRNESHHFGIFYYCSNTCFLKDFIVICTIFTISYFI